MIVLLPAAVSKGQVVSIRKDTIYSYGTAYAAYRRSGLSYLRFIIGGFNGNDLIDVHYSHMDIKGKQSYVVTFLANGKQGMILMQTKSPEKLVAEIVKGHLIDKGISVNEKAAEDFLRLHPLPKGFTDVDKSIEY